MEPRSRLIAQLACKQLEGLRFCPSLGLGCLRPHITSHGVHGNKEHVRSASRHTQRATLQLVSRYPVRFARQSHPCCSLTGLLPPRCCGERPTARGQRPPSCSCGRAGGTTPLTAQRRWPLSAIRSRGVRPDQERPYRPTVPGVPRAQHRRLRAHPHPRLRSRLLRRLERAHTAAKRSGVRKSMRYAASTCRGIHWPHPSTDDGGVPPPTGSSRQDWPGRLGPHCHEWVRLCAERAVRN